MTGQLPLGHLATLPGLAGRWSLWSDAAEGPGSKFFVPADDAARATGAKYAVVRVKYARSKPEPELRVLRTDPPIELDVVEEEPA